MPVEPQIPPAGEEIHLPGLSVHPILVAVGTTIALLGVTWNAFVCAFGVILTAWTIVLWVRDAKRDIDELPVHEHH